MPPDVHQACFFRNSVMTDKQDALSVGVQERARPLHPYLLLKGGLVDPRMGASNEHFLILYISL